VSTSLHGPNADVFAWRWTGSIQWIAQSPVRPHHKRKNWFIGLFALPPESWKDAVLATADVPMSAALELSAPRKRHRGHSETSTLPCHVQA
jgi:peptide chain release factor